MREIIKQHDTPKNDRSHKTQEITKLLREGAFCGTQKWTKQTLWDSEKIIVWNQHRNVGHVPQQQLNPTS